MGRAGRRRDRLVKTRIRATGLNALLLDGGDTLAPRSYYLPTTRKRQGRLVNVHERASRPDADKTFPLGNSRLGSDRVLPKIVEGTTFCGLGKNNLFDAEWDEPGRAVSPL